MRPRRRRSRELRGGPRYGVGLLVEVALLASAWQLLGRDHPSGEYLGVMASGLQNGLVTTWSGAIVRTSHVTGTLTDIGVAMGLRLRSVPLDRRIALHLVLVVAFGFGGVVGALGWKWFGFDALCLPMFICLTLAAATVRDRGT